MFTILLPFVRMQGKSPQNSLISFNFSHCLALAIATELLEEFSVE